jgi:alpha/beta superfamily hydrolase
MTTRSSIRSFFLDGPSGRLEALLNVGAPSASRCAVVTHPHPLYGGTMHNKVVFHAMKALNGFGFPVLRFNFRGVGASGGEHDHGRGEIDDVRAALDWLHAEFGLPIVFAGFSFGAATGLRAACPDAHVNELISLGTPISAEGREYNYDLLRECRKPKLFVSGDHDQFAPVEMLREVVAAAAEPKRLVLVPEADHFFAGHLDEMREAIQSWVRDTIAPGA